MMTRMLQAARDNSVMSRLLDIEGLLSASLSLPHRLTSSMALLDALFEFNAPSSTTVKRLRRAYHVTSARLEIGRAKTLKTLAVEGEGQRQAVNSHYDECHQRLIILAMDKLKSITSPASFNAGSTQSSITAATAGTPHARPSIDVNHATRTSSTSL
jgi:hypothetical protein